MAPESASCIISRNGVTPMYMSQVEVPIAGFRTNRSMPNPWVGATSAFSG